MLKSLSRFELSAKTGCLPEQSIFALALPPELQVAKRTASLLPTLLPSGRVRELIRKELADVPLGNALEACTHEEARLALLHYLFLAHAHVWGDPSISQELPSYLAVPVVTLAERVGQPPILTYRNYVLDNWDTIIAGDGIALENLRIPQQFLGGIDEHWFIAVHVAVEAAAAPGIAAVPALVEGAKLGDEGAVLSALELVGKALREINTVFARMTECCDPHTYFLRVRPYIHGWKDNPRLPAGLVYKGVAQFGDMPQQFRGETGAQSAVIPIFDAALGITHAENDGLRPYLDDLHQYRPVGHRDFIDEVTKESLVRDVARRSNAVREGYNWCVSEIRDFRQKHLTFANHYVFQQAERAGMQSKDIGTGGTPFVKYLGKHYAETEASEL